MNGKIFFPVLVAISLLTLGCNNPGTTKTKTFVGGTNGVLINFAQEAPPAEVYDSCAGGNNQFDIVVELNNDGEYDVSKENALITITGIMPEDFGYSASMLSKNPPEDLMGKKVGQPSVPVQVEFPNLAYRGNVLGDRSFPIRAEICYTYQSTAIAQTCIRSDLKSTSQGSCTVEGSKPVDGSGAPIQVTSFVESVAGNDQVRYEITIEHKGNGNVFVPSSKCVDTYANRNRVYVNIVSRIPGLKCTGLRGGTDTSGYVTLNSEKGTGKAVISCIQKIPQPEQGGRIDYTSDLTVTMSYDYLSYKIQQLTVKKSC